MDVTSIDHDVRARLGTWPYEPGVAHLVLLDHQMVPTVHHVRSWVDTARGRGAHAIRTGALFPNSVAAFERAGFRLIDELALLELDLNHSAVDAADVGRTHRLRSHHLVRAAAVDRHAFASPWGCDTAALDDVLRATPRHRARTMTVDRRIVAFAITGVANCNGYLQRLAVDPTHQRAGFGRTLVRDSLDWMRRRRARLAMVNTALDNEPALALYESLGFRRRPDSLVILELQLKPNV